jgi:hypothetical protein
MLVFFAQVVYPGTSTVYQGVLLPQTKAQIDNLLQLNQEQHLEIPDNL